jgi:hypothetical protein
VIICQIGTSAKDMRRDRTHRRRCLSGAVSEKLALPNIHYIIVVAALGFGVGFVFVSVFTKTTPLTYRLSGMLSTEGRLLTLSCGLQESRDVRTREVLVLVRP